LPPNVCAPAALKKAKKGKKHGPHHLGAIQRKNRVVRIAQQAKAKNGRKGKAA
jgi:hypothetical protein